MTHLIKKKINNQLCLSKQDIKDTVNYILSNCDFRVGKKIFSQIIGIPIGSEPAPFFDNMFLYCYESREIKHLQKNDNWQFQIYVIFSALLMILMQSMMLEYLKITSGIYTQKNYSCAERMAIMLRQTFQIQTSR